ncbi:hypothetical protein [Croceitalea rosinachiae]|uniref:3-keto-disaccharide hydrolase domain-containing protein n=1 Tax=Croceitalea rosinachiae TaxID=3075596 RepID=A0ABU3AD76_9FLAO|nr:hypothetical protein [Croceitalea sp. F388]MDT0608134.1 hypothetical protein [Croceitalea sp. F388]
MKIRYTNLLFIVLFSMLFVNGQQSIFQEGAYIVYSEDNEKVVLKDTLFKGRRALKLDGTSSSIALLDDINTKNFRVEMDIAGQVMSGLGFHAKDGMNYQFIYFRPQMGNTSEAIQYIPIYNGALSWVFYNYPVYETSTDIKSLEWFHAAFEVRGKNLKVFVNDEPEPKMNISILDNPVDSGKLLLRSLFGPSYFANITWQALTNTEIKEKTLPQTDFLTKWEISEQFPRDTITDYFDNILKRANVADNWKTINMVEDSYVNFSRYFKHPRGVLVAKTSIEADNQSIKNLHFDFVGRVKIILNGNDLFTYKKIRFERVFDSTFSIGLPLKEGKNELIVIVEGDAAFFGKGFRYLGRNQHTNWGFIARVED